VVRYNSRQPRRLRPEYIGPDPAGINATVALMPKGGLQFKIRELR
jgi:hypothetical protein